MEVAIGQPARPEHVSTFVAEIRFMHGDADLYTTEEYLLKDEDEVKAFAEALAWLHTVDPHYDRLGAYKRDDTMTRTKADPRYTRFFYSYTEADWEEDRKDNPDKYPKTYAEAVKQGWGEEYWPRDHECSDYPAAFEGVKYFWFDEAGVKYPVTVK